MTQNILSILLILVTARLFGELFKRIGQAQVLGELVGGVILGSSVLGWVKPNDCLMLLSQLGVILLLFEVGLESDFAALLKAGPSAFMVALIGTAGPFTAGYFAAGLLGFSPLVAVFLGATFTATSVGITARTLKDLRRLGTPEARVILGAAVIDDIIGLVVLAAVSSLMINGAVSALSVGKMVTLSMFFLAGSITLGLWLAPYVLKYTWSLQSRGLLTIIVIAFCLSMALAAEKLHLAMIIGAFAAGLILSRSEHTVHVEERVRPIGDFLVPFFFVMLGTAVDISIFNPFDPANRVPLILIAVMFGIVMVMKMLSGMGVITRGVNRLIVGVGMTPPGEVCLIFASIGLAHKFISAKEYSSILAVVALTTFLNPLLLKAVFRGRVVEKEPVETCSEG